MTTVTVTMREPRRSEDGLSIWPAGSTQTASLEYGHYLVRSGFATSGDDLSRSRGTNPLMLTQQDEASIRTLLGGDAKVIVISASAPVNSDGRPDGTVYIQTA